MPSLPTSPLRLLCLTRPDDKTMREALQESLAPLGDAITLDFTDPSAPDSGLLAAADVALCGSLPSSLRAQMPALKWVQFWSAGVDGKLYPELFADSVQVATGSGIHAASCSEHVLAMILAFARGLPQSFAAQQRRDWAARRAISEAMFELEEKTVGIVGAGVIGQAIGRRCQAFGMRTIGTKRNVDEPVEGIDVLLPHILYHELILASNFIVLALPLTPSTRMMFGEDEIEIVHKGTYLFNIGRGGLIDERWVLKALQKGWLAGAGLDVFVDEPLPPESPFWELDNCLITPHVGGVTPAYWPRYARLVAEQTRRYLAGDSLKNLVDKDLGY